jgi:hypothetical protein
MFEKGMAGCLAATDTCLVDSFSNVVAHATPAGG